ncbi:unnamed protein product [Malus baccata var. baccata]
MFLFLFLPRSGEITDFQSDTQKKYFDPIRRGRLKKLGQNGRVQESRIRLGTWNIGTLTGKSMEVVEVIVRRRINIMCLQETKWVGLKAKDLENSGFKLWYSGTNKTRNGVGIIVDKTLTQDVVDVKRVGDRIMAIKIVIGQELINPITTQHMSMSEQVLTDFMHQQSLSPYLFALVMDELTGHIQDVIPWCMLYADDIGLIDETQEGVNAKLNLWRKPIKDRIYGIQAGWMKWKSASGVLCDRRIPLKLKGKFYRTSIRSTMMYDTECWAVKHQHVHKMGVAEMRMLRWRCGLTRKDKIRNKWVGHVQRRPIDALVQRCDYGTEIRAEGVEEDLGKLWKRS